MVAIPSGNMYYVRLKALPSSVYAQANLGREEGLSLCAESSGVQSPSLLTFHQATLIVGIYL